MNDMQIIMRECIVSLTYRYPQILVTAEKNHQYLQFELELMLPQINLDIVAGS